MSSPPGVRSRAGPCLGCGLCVVAQAPVKEFPPSLPALKRIFVFSTFKVCGSHGTSQEGTFPAFISYIAYLTRSVCSKLLLYSTERA